MISVVVPTYNEKESVSEFLRVLKQNLKTEFNVIMIDDSNDNTAKVAETSCKQLGIKSVIIHRRGKKGKGSAVADGLKLAKGDTIVIIDADLEYHPRYITPMIKKLSDCDVVTAVRIRRDVWYRQILGALFKFAVRLMFGIPFETQSGLKVMKRSAVKNIEIESIGWSWDVEFIKKLMNNKAVICTHTIPYTTREFGSSKINFFTPIQMLLDLIVLRFKL
ncbi:Glycosyltransferase AglD [Candidatus Tiddalikarchaeum anstoanum]|nr:Glycosyltransferase AglD [Candidatus Tiddalikarchaeum anstoanum]